MRMTSCTMHKPPKTFCQTVFPFVLFCVPAKEKSCPFRTTRAERSIPGSSSPCFSIQFLHNGSFHSFQFSLQLPLQQTNADILTSRNHPIQIHWLMLISRQGKVRLAKWFEPYTETQRAEVTRDVVSNVLPRSSKMCNVVDMADNKVVYKRYASLYFIACTDREDNELLTMELLHMFVEVLDTYFGNVCELDLIFNFTRSYWILDQIFISGELQECSKAAILAAIQTSDSAAEAVPEFGPRSSHPHGYASSRRR